MAWNTARYTTHRAEAILDQHGVSTDCPTLAQLTALSPVEWIVLLDALIDRSFVDTYRLQMLLWLPQIQPWLMHRWTERSMQSIERLSALLPAWIGFEDIDKERINEPDTTARPAGSVPLNPVSPVSGDAGVVTYDIEYVGRDARGGVLVTPHVPAAGGSPDHEPDRDGAGAHREADAAGVLSATDRPLDPARF